MLPSPVMFTMRLTARIVVLAGVLVLLAAGCSRGGRAQLPAGDTLIRAAAQEMQGVQSMAFDLETAGPVGNTDIRGARGALTREKGASGTVLVQPADTPVEYQFVISGGQVYLKGPTGGFQSLPLSASPYDPTELLNPSGGLADFLKTTSGGRTEAADTVDGAATYRVSATIATSALERFLPVALQEDKVPTVLWIGRNQPLLHKLRLTAHLREQSKPTTLTVILSNFNAPVDITPPLT
jgi:lipoprotein LprG